MAEWYCDVTLSGNKSVKLIRDSHFIWNGTTVPLPAAGNVLYTRIHPNGSRFAGVGHRDDYCWEWLGTAWKKHNKKCYGPQSVFYDRAGTLLIKSTWPASGYRYQDTNGRIYTCTETYANATWRIWEYSTHGDLTIGQGGDNLGAGDDPIIALYKGKRKLLQSGRCRFINSYREGNNIAYAAVRQDTSQSLIRFLTVAQIESSPDIGSPPPAGTHPPAGYIPPGGTSPIPVPPTTPPTTPTGGGGTGIGTSVQGRSAKSTNKQPQFADLKATLAQSKSVDNALSQTLQELIERLMQFQMVTVESVTTSSKSGSSAVAAAANNIATYITKNNETASLKNSLQLLAGAGITLDTSIANRIVINSTLVSGGNGTGNGNGNGVIEILHHYDSPLSDGHGDEANLIYANGECIIVQVPV